MNECKRCGQVAWLNALHRGMCYSCHEAEAIRVVEDANAGVLREGQSVRAISCGSMDEFVTGDCGEVTYECVADHEYLVDFGYREDYVVQFDPADNGVQVVPLLDLFVVEWDEDLGLFTFEHKVRQRRVRRLP